MSRSLFNRFHFLKNTNIEELPPDIFFATFGSIIGLHATYTYSTMKKIDIVIKQKYIFTKNGFSEFMIIDHNNKHYNVTNSIWFWKWNSIEDWNNLELNESTNIIYYGIRIPIFGVFPNVVASSKKIS